MKKVPNVNLRENALHSRPANEPNPAPPTIRWAQCLSATDGLHLGDAGGEEKSNDEDESRKAEGLYSFRDNG